MTPSNQFQEQNEVLAILGTRHRCLWNKYSDEKRFQLYKLSGVNFGHGGNSGQWGVTQPYKYSIV